MAEMICASCGAVFPANKKFCVNCGAKAPEPSAPKPVDSGLPPRPAAPHTEGAAHTAPVPAPVSAPPPVPATAPMPAVSIVPDAKAMNAFDYTLALILFSIPLAGIALAFVWALGKKTSKARRDLSLARLIVWGIVLIIALVFYIMNFNAVNELVKVIIS